MKSETFLTSFAFILTTSSIDGRPLTVHHVLGFIPLEIHTFLVRTMFGSLTQRARST
jgi:hypothetical protein